MRLQPMSIHDAGEQNWQASIAASKITLSLDILAKRN